MNIYKKIHTHINIRTQDTDYIIGTDLLGNIPRGNFLLLSSKSVFEIHGKKITGSLKKTGREIVVSIIDDGEDSKNFSNLNEIISPFIQTNLNKNTILIALGGGVVTDIGGFIGTILIRGIKTIFIPTTLLAQIDASIGGKNGMNYKIGDSIYKNMMGTITQPSLVISDIDLLKTLPRKEWTSGLGELVKYTIGWGIPSIDQLNAIKTPRRWSKASVQVEELAKTISSCQKLKLDVIEKDPHDTLHVRDSLNFGHTIGHAVEVLSKGILSHGESVAIGLNAASLMSLKMGFISLGIHQENETLISSLGLPTKIKNISQKDILNHIKFDKKGGRFVLLKSRHRLQTDVVVPQAIINQTLDEIIL